MLYPLPMISNRWPRTAVYSVSGRAGLAKRREWLVCCLLATPTAAHDYVAGISYGYLEFKAALGSVSGA